MSSVSVGDSAGSEVGVDEAAIRCSSTDSSLRTPRMKLSGRLIDGHHTVFGGSAASGRSPPHAMYGSSHSFGDDEDGALMVGFGPFCSVY